MSKKCELDNLVEPTAEDLAKIEQKYDTEKMKHEVIEEDSSAKKEFIRQEELNRYAKWFKR